MCIKADSLWVKLAEVDREMYILVHTKETPSSEVICTSQNLNDVYEKFYSKKYQDFFSFLYDVMIHDLPLPNNTLKAMYWYHIPQLTHISKEAKNGEEYIIGKYMKAVDKNLIIKSRLSKREEIDLIRVFLRGGYYISMNEESGRYIFLSEKTFYSQKPEERIKLLKNLEKQNK